MDSADIPPQAITDATEAVARELRKMPGKRDERAEENILRLAFDLATAALDAVLPHLGAPERADRIVSAIFACGSEDCPRPFALYRHQDVTGVSGTGSVAHGVQFADRTVVIRWLGEHPSTVVWASLDDAMKIHGHDGSTRVVWLAAEFSEMAKAEQQAVAAERERCAQLADSVGAIYPLPPTASAVTVNDELVPATAGNVVIWPDGMPAIGLVGCLLRETQP